MAKTKQEKRKQTKISMYVTDVEALDKLKSNAEIVCCNGRQIVQWCLRRVAEMPPEQIQAGLKSVSHTLGKPAKWPYSIWFVKSDLDRIEKIKAAIGMAGVRRLDSFIVRFVIRLMASK